MTDLDPSVIMAQHRPNEAVPGRRHRGCDRCMATWPCLPYRLAAEVARLREAYLILDRCVDLNEGARDEAESEIARARRMYSEVNDD